MDSSAPRLVRLAEWNRLGECHAMLDRGEGDVYELGKVRPTPFARLDVPLRQGLPACACREGEMQPRARVLRPQPHPTASPPPPRQLLTCPPLHQCVTPGCISLPHSARMRSCPALNSAACDSTSTPHPHRLKPPPTHSRSALLPSADSLLWTAPALPSASTHTHRLFLRPRVDKWITPPCAAGPCPGAPALAPLPTQRHTPPPHSPSGLRGHSGLHPETFLPAHAYIAPLMY
jgi:hypothetical protein